MAPYPKPGEAGYGPNVGPNSRSPISPLGQPLLSHSEQAHMPHHHRRNISGSYSDEMGPGEPMRAGYTDPYATGPGGLGHAGDVGVPQGRGEWVDEGRYNGADFRDERYEQGHEYRYDEGIPRNQYDAHDNRGYSRQ